VGNIVQLFGRPLEPAHEQTPEPADIQLTHAIEANGLHAPGHISFDGRIHRFSADGSRSDQAGWYVAFDDGIPAGAFGTWKEEGKHQWRADIGRELTEIESLKVTERLRAAAEIRDKERETMHHAAAKSCGQIWEDAEPAPDDHPYLQEKQVSPHGLKMTPDGRLLLPLWTPDGEISSLQYITDEGRKKFHPGGKTAGSFWWIGNVEDAKRVYIAEGYATAASIHEVTGSPVIIAYNAKNLIPVASSIREQMPLAKLIIVADNDLSGTGRKCADEASAKTGAEVVMPPDIGDANDYLLAGGNLKDLLEPKSKEWLIAADEFSQDPSPLQWLVKHWLQDKAMIMVHGPSGSGKTFVVLDWCLHIASEKTSWMGCKVQSGHVVYLAGEGHYGLRSRVAAWKQHHQVDRLDMSVSVGAVDLNTPEGLRKTISSIASLEKQPKLIVVDTLHRFFAGDENSAQDTKTMLDACAHLMEEFSCSVALVHHTGVSSEAQHRARGSSAWRAAMDIDINIEPGGVTKPIRIIQKKVKDAEMVDAIHVDLEQVQLPWLDDDGEYVTSAVVTEGITPVNKQRDAKQQERVNDMIQAWLGSGAEDVDGIPYITKSAWKDYYKSENPEAKEGTLNQKFKISDSRSMISKLLAEGLIQEFRAGYQVIDGETSSVMMLTRFGSTGSTTVGIPRLPGSSR
jgi:phage/plasmid primase-like uncharacterized protein